jgi:DNA-binding NarL/FixJ family response regulator
MLLEREGGETALRDAKALIENLKQNVGRKQSECARKKSDKSKRKDQRRSISIVVADDHPVVLHGLADVLRSNSDMKVVAVCSDGATALEAIRKWSPNVAVLDVLMPGLSGLDVLACIKVDGLATKVVLTAAASDGQLLRATAGGVHGIVLKEEALTELVQCVRTVGEDRPWFRSVLVNAALERETGQRSSQRLTQLLTTRERQVTLLVAEGFSNKEVGRRLELSEGTVKIHLHNIYQKLHVNNRTTLAALTMTHRDELASPGGDLPV